MIHFTFEIKTNVEKYILELSKEIPKKTVTFPSGAAQIII
jgi:hypothetical protein